MKKLIVLPIEDEYEPPEPDFWSTMGCCSMILFVITFWIVIVWAIISHLGD